MAKHHQILIIGGGAAGIAAAAQIRNKLKLDDIAIIEPSDKHYYQAGWTLVGAGIIPKENTIKNEADYMPKRVKWIQDAVTDIDPDNNSVSLKSGEDVSYDYLIVASGIQLDWDKVKGLKETLGKNGVGSNYSYNTVDYTWKALQEFKGGNAIFTNPLGQIKCGGAPQKVMYLSEQYMRKKGIRDKAKVIGAFAGTMMLGVPEVNKSLFDIVEKRDIEMRFYHDLVEVKGDEHIAIFNVRDPKTGEHIKREEIEFNFLHATPPQSAPDYLKNTKLAVTEGPHKGFVDVDKHIFLSMMLMMVNIKLDATIKAEIPVADSAKKSKSAVAMPKTPKNAFLDCSDAPCEATVIADGPGTKINKKVVMKKME